MSIVDLFRWLTRKARKIEVQDFVKPSLATQAVEVDPPEREVANLDALRQTPYAIPKAEDSVIGADAVMTGTLKTSGRLIVEGRLSGIIEQKSSGANVFVDEAAVIRGEINASNTLVYGLVVGTITSTLISVEKIAKITGAIEYRDIRIKGGIFGVNLRQNKSLPLLIEDKETQKAISG